MHDHLAVFRRRRERAARIERIMAIILMYYRVPGILE